MRCIKRECDRDGEVDILKWWHFMAGDIISWLMFGESFDLLALGHVSDQPKSIERPADIS